MKLSKHVALITMLFVMALTGCSDSDTNSTNGSGGLPMGNLLGRMSGLMDSIGNWQSDLSGVTVEAVGSGISTQSDSSGYWELKNLPSRTYDLRFSKPGYMDNYYTGYSFLGGATTWIGDNGYLFMKPSFTITLDALFLNCTNGIFSGKVYSHFSDNVPSRGAGTFVVFGTDSTIDLNDNRTYIQYLYVDNGQFDNNTKSLLIQNWQTHDSIHFHSGQILYCRLFPFNYTHSYFDANKRQYIFVGQGAGSNVLSQVLQ